MNLKDKKYAKKHKKPSSKKHLSVSQVLVKYFPSFT